LSGTHLLNRLLEIAMLTVERENLVDQLGANALAFYGQPHSRIVSQRAQVNH
jgi:hypothetical protein